MQHSLLRRALPGVATTALLATAATAQQFQYQPGMIPGTPRWTEGLEPADVDNDGDLDIFFAEGEGFSSAGAKRQNVLVINQKIETGNLAFTEESVARLGVHLSNAKGVAAGDIDADGWVDALFANAFNTDTPFLYHNRGAGQPGFFDMESAARGLTENYSSGSAQFGDVDDDGDLDLIICDSGASFLGGVGGEPHLFYNDGAGNFSEAAPAAWSPLTKKAHMDVQLVDVDGDWDLDFFGANRSSNTNGTHYLMLNNGDGSFTDASTTIPNTSGSVYEAEIGDLDDDTDIDIFFVSLTGFQEGAMRNDLIPSGTLGFTSTGGLGLSQDDNEIALCDFDSDGDLDAFVGSLAGQERLWRNDGGFNFVGSHTSIQVVNDSTLDIAIGDLDLDGTYDLISAQGESNSPQWANKVYLNSGPADTMPPRVVAEQPVAQLGSDTGPFVGHAKVRDQVIEDGINYVTATSVFVINPTPLSDAVTITNAGFSNISVAAGTTVTWTNASGADQTVTSQSSPFDYDSGTIPNGGTYSRTFVSPGPYSYISQTSGFTGMVTVTGSITTVAATYMTGNQYRFAMSGDASSPTAQLAYECFFSDFVGNRSVSASHTADKAGPVGNALCFGDGSGAACGCMNEAAMGSGTGCENSTGVGAELTADGAPSLANDTLVLTGAQLPNQPGLYFQGDLTIAGGAGATFGDGLRCCGMNLVRLETVSASGGTSSTGLVISQDNGQNLSAGETKCYQLWYRDPSGGPCGNAFNLTNALEITWEL